MTDPTLTPDTINRLANTVPLALAMLAGMQLDVFSCLRDGPMSSEGIASSLGVGADKLEPLLYALVSANLLVVEGKLFTNTLETDHFLVRGSPTYIGGRHGAFKERWGAIFKTADSVLAGTAQAKLDFSAMSPDEQMTYRRSRYSESVESTRDLVKRYNFSKYRNLIDAGGGVGGLAITITEACPHLQAVVAELPNVIPTTQVFVEEAGATHLVKAVAVDVVNGPIPGSFDVAVLRSLIQVLSPDQARRAIQSVGQVLEPGGEIYILGQVIDDSRTSPTGAVGMNLYFINIYDGGLAYTEKEHREWLSDAGFSDFERATLPNGTSIIRACKPG